MEKYLNDFDKVSIYHRFKLPIDRDIRLSKDNIDEIEKLRLFYVDHANDILLSRNNEVFAKKGIVLAKEYLEDNFILNKINILSENNKKILDEKKEHYDGGFKTFMMDNIWYRSNIDKINPLDLSVDLKNGDHFDAGKANIVFPTIGEHVLNPYVDGIYINPACSQIADTSYIHEIVHTQMEQSKKSYDDIFQLEIISYLMELIFSADYCSKIKVRSEELSTIRTMLHDYNNINEHICDNIYFYSKYMALKLFAIYYNLDDQHRNEMKYFIQKIWDGYFSVGELLDNYDVSLDNVNSDEFIRKLTIK